MIDEENLDSNLDFDEPPQIEDLLFFANMLRDANLRKRRKGAIGKALRELDDVRQELLSGQCSLDNRRRIDKSLWKMNGHATGDGDYVKGPLGLGQFCWRPNHRPRGSTKRTVDEVRHDAIFIENAETLQRQHGFSNKNALTTVVATALENGDVSANTDCDSVVKRLARMQKQQMQYAEEMRRKFSRALEHNHELRRRLQKT